MSERLPRRVAVLSVHTSPTEQPGTGDAGGMNVYVAQTAIRMARRGVEAEIFTRATSSEQPPTVELEPGATVRFVAAGPFEGLGKDDLPSQLCAFTAGVLRAEARHDPGWYDVVHSHYWLSGQVGWLARDRWGVPLVHSAHTLAKVKNAALAAGDTPEPRVRVIGEDQVVAEADRLVANTEIESKQLLDLYDADPRRTVTIPPGVDTDRFRPGDRAAARAELEKLGISETEINTPRPAPSWTCPPGRWCWRSSDASSGSRPPTCCCAPRPSWPRVHRGCGSASSCSSRAGRPGRGWPSRRRCTSWRPSWGSPTSSGSCRPGPATSW